MDTEGKAETPTEKRKVAEAGVGGLAGAGVGGWLGASIGIAAFGTGIAGVVPMAIVGGLLGLGVPKTVRLGAKATRLVRRKYKASKGKQD